ncbi:unnamed protein product [Ectocarpus fasciculatus]
MPVYSNFGPWGVCSQRRIATISLSGGCKQRVNYFRVGGFRDRRKRGCGERCGPGGGVNVFNSCGLSEMYMCHVCFLGSAVTRSARGRYWRGGSTATEKQALQPSRRIALPRKLHTIYKLMDFLFANSGELFAFMGWEVNRITFILANICRSLAFALV